MPKGRREMLKSVDGSFVRLLGWTSLVFLLCMGLLLAGSVQWSRFQHLEDAQEIARGMARLVASEMGRRIDLTDLVLTNMVELGRQADWSDPETAPRLRLRLQELALQLPDIHELRLLDADGLVRVSARLPAGAAPDFDDRDYFALQKERPQGLVIGRLVEGRTDGTLALPLSRRISGPNGEFLGVAVAAFKEETLSRLFQTISIPYPFTLAVYEANGHLVARYPMLLPNPMLNVTLPEPMARLAAENQEGGGADLENGQDLLWAFSRVGRNGVVAVASLPLANVQATWRRDILPSLVFGLVSLCGLTLLGAVAFRRARAEQASQARLVQASNALELMLDEKDVLLAEVHHRVKNNMQVIVTLLQMEELRADDPKARLRFEALAGRVALMGRVHERLYASDSLARLDVLSLLIEHCAELSRRHPAAAVLVTGEPMACGLDVALPIALIAHELVSNALDHGGPRPLVKVVLSRGEDCFSLAIRDSGGGPVAETEGMGRVLVQALAAQIGGEVVDDRNGGYAVTLILPVDRLGGE